MRTSQPVEFRCQYCGQVSKTQLTVIIDANHNPEAKRELLGGVLNTVQCPQCGQATTASTPLVYHDASKEMLITFVPTELHTSADVADKMVGSLVREVTDSMENRLIKSYVLQPRRALTLQGLVEQILESDGISKEVLEAQKERARLIQMFLQTGPEMYEALVKEHDTKLDEAFFQTMSMVAEQYAQQGRPDLGEHVVVVQQRIASLSTVGQQILEKNRAQDVAIETAAKALQSFPQQPTPAELVALVQQHVDDEMVLQAFVAMARPIFDYGFFEALTETIDKLEGDDKQKLSAARDMMHQLTQAVDGQSQAQMQQAVEFLRQILGAPDPKAVIKNNLHAIDDTLMAVLDLNIQEAQKNGDERAATELLALRDHIQESLREQMQPEVRFINDLLEAPSQDAALAKVEAEASQFGDELLQAFDALIELIAAQGHQELSDKLRFLREKTAPHIKTSKD